MGIRANREGFLRDRMQLPFQTVCLCLSIFCCFGSGVSLRALFLCLCLIFSVFSFRSGQRGFCFQRFVFQTFCFLLRLSQRGGGFFSGSFYVFCMFFGRDRLLQRLFGRRICIDKQQVLRGVQRRELLQGLRKDDLL